MEEAIRAVTACWADAWADAWSSERGRLEEVVPNLEQRTERQRVHKQVEKPAHDFKRKEAGVYGRAEAALWARTAGP